VVGLKPFRRAVARSVIALIYGWYPCSSLGECGESMIECAFGQVELLVSIELAQKLISTACNERLIFAGPVATVGPVVHGSIPPIQKSTEKAAPRFGIRPRHASWTCVPGQFHSILNLSLDRTLLSSAAFVPLGRSPAVTMAPRNVSTGVPHHR
jgi:hypothetical protein